MRALAIVACMVGAIAALGLTLLAAGDLYLTGFPDSHLTDYDKAVEVPKRILMWAEFGFVPVFVLLALPRIRERARAVGPAVALIVLGLVVVVQLVGVPWYFGTHLGLDTGIGG
jgi:MFS superfamily sulfate permease-like transporter